ncbi:hypothetical protein BJ978_000756 [Agromyces terreus]|uniref:Secreted protein n=1 Tax=Agromyces terreus TaxID=424795 RepID=A0A9X2GVZ5_9MICO|nr:hypothetical protein [Agromyces terreus]MCP2370080.1 hypothetical protein [Agromyces terreus]
MQKIITTTALAFAGALLFTGCATGSGSDNAADDNCEVVRVAVRDISNGAQNAIAASADQTTLLERLDDYSQRLDELAEENADDAELSEAIGGLQDKVTAAEEYAATLPAEPTEDAEIDADAQATASGDIQAAAVTVTEVCTTE